MILERASELFFRVILKFQKRRVDSRHFRLTKKSSSIKIPQ
jgi:hypothetical protein